MKKTICLNIIIFIFVNTSVLCGCSNSTSSENADNRITLTIDNYSNYLDIKGGTQYKGYQKNGYERVNCNINIQGASPNFIYNDV